MLTLKSGVRRPNTSRVPLMCVAVLALLPLAEPVSAQGTAPPSIIGQVTDDSGAVLPGVTVTTTSPALQVPQMVAVTDERGEYRLSPLVVGVYSVTYELTGFQTLRQEGIRLTLGFVARLDQILRIGALTETITVSGASPLVDVTSTETRTELTNEAVELLPTSRDGVKAFFTQVPSVRDRLSVGSSGLTQSTQYNTHGQAGGNWPTLEGVFAGTPIGSHFEFNSLDGVRVQTSGSNAEMPRRGMLVDMVMKSGGNDFHGNAHFGFSNNSLEGSNLNERLAALGVTKVPALHLQRDLSANLGGRIIRNKLWFYGAGRELRSDVEAVEAFYDDGSPILTNSRTLYHVEKLSYQMTLGNKITAFNHFGQESQVRGATRFVPAESRSFSKTPYHTRKIEWQHVRGNSLVFSVQQGYFGYPNGSDTSVSPGKPATIDIATLFVTGDAITDGNRNNYQRHHSKAVVSWYRPDLFAGAHEFKGGVDRVHAVDAPFSVPRAGGEYQLRFNNGVPFEINTRNTPNQTEAHDTYFGVYGQDNWTIARRLTLSLGLRYDRNAGWVPAQCREAAPFAAAGCFPEVAMRTFNALGPRAHAAFDVFGNGRTAIKGGYGRFNHMREPAEESALNRNVRSETTWKWHDLNGNRNYDPGEVDLNPNGRDFVAISTGTPRIPNPNEKQPKTDVFTLSLDRELAANWAVRVGGFYGKNFNTPRLLSIDRPYEAYNIPITRPDPGPDGRLGTADDPGRSITFYEYPVALRGRDFETTMVITDPKADFSFKAIEVGATRRLSDGWQLVASYSATKHRIPFGRGEERYALPIMAYNPNAEIFTADNTWEWIAKASGANTFLHDIIGSVNFEHRSGEPLTRQVLFTGGTTILTIVLNVEPVGSRRTHHTNVLDLGVEKRLALGGDRSLGLRAELFNTLNISSVRNWNQRSGANFLNPVTPLDVTPPRVLQFDVSYTF